MTKQILTTLGIAALGIASYATTYMQITTDDGNVAYYDVEHVIESKFLKEEVTPVDSTSKDSSTVALPSSYEVTYMQVIKDDGEEVRYDIDHVTDVTFVTEAEINHEYVDLGLPSGTLWATCNVGVLNSSDIGDNFRWGETETGSDDDYSCHKRMIKYDNQYGGQKTLLPEDDAATVNWGADWRMPTKEEINELLTQCENVPVIINEDVAPIGMKFIGPNGNSVFFTYGTYWSNMCVSESKEEAFALFIYLATDGTFDIRGQLLEFHSYAEALGGNFLCCGDGNYYDYYVRPVRSNPLP